MVKKKPGRPPAPDPLVPLQVRIPLSLRTRFEKAARKEKVSLSEWIRKRLDGLV